MDKKKDSKRIENLKYQADDILKRLDVSDIETAGVTNELKEKIEKSKPEELENLEKQLGIDAGKRVEELIEEIGSSEGEEIPYAVQSVSVEGEGEEGGDDEQGEESVDGSFSIEVSEDKMSATITLIPSRGKGAPLNFLKVKKAIEQRGIVYGVNYDLLQKLVESVEKNKEAKEGVIFAQGTPPEEGEDGKIEFHFSETDDIFDVKDEEKDDEMVG